MGRRKVCYWVGAPYLITVSCQANAKANSMVPLLLDGKRLSVLSCKVHCELGFGIGDSGRRLIRAFDSLFSLVSHSCITRGSWLLLEFQAHDHTVVEAHVGIDIVSSALRDWSLFQRSKFSMSLLRPDACLLSIALTVLYGRIDVCRSTSKRII